MIRSRLYIKMYLTVLCGLMLVVLSLGTFAMLADDDEDHGFSGKIDRFAGALLSADMTRQQRQDMLERLARGLSADVAVFDRNENYVQGAGALSSKAAADLYLAEDGHRHKREFEADLPDGSRVLVFMDSQFDKAKGKFLLAILIVAVAIGIASLPAVRYLTRRLEDLRQGVENWGEGALSSRIEVCGQDEIALVARSFNNAADRVEKLIKSQKSLLANASHELRSPLARLRMAAEMFEASPSDSLREEIVRNLSELDELVDEILLKSRLDSDQKPELDQLVDLLPLAAEEAAAVGAEIDGEPLTVPGNERLLRRVIRNLVQNAARHGKPPVTVYVSAQEGRARIAVCDLGDGIKPEEAARVFEPFYRPEGRSESAGGWGLGLALVAEIARLHGGRAWYTPLDDGGACFTVEIPLDRPAGKTS
jgi:two-component system OmpR family sensor kinase